jgi:hypothetical protein
VGIYTAVFDEIVARINAQNGSGGFMEGELKGVYIGKRSFAFSGLQLPAVLIYWDGASHDPKNLKSGPSNIKNSMSIRVGVELLFKNYKANKNKDVDMITDTGGIVELLEKVHDAIYTVTGASPASSGANSRSLGLNGRYQLNITDISPEIISQEGIQSIITLFECSTAITRINARRV